MDGLAVGGRKAGGGAVEQVLARLVEEEDGGEDTVDLALHQVADRLQHLGEGAVVVDHVENPALSGEPISRLLLRGLEVRCGFDSRFHWFAPPCRVVSTIASGTSVCFSLVTVHEPER